MHDFRGAEFFLEVRHNGQVTAGKAVDCLPIVADGKEPGIRRFKKCLNESGPYAACVLEFIHKNQPVGICPSSALDEFRGLMHHAFEIRPAVFLEFGVPGPFQGGVQVEEEFFSIPELLGILFDSTPQICDGEIVVFGLGVEDGDGRQKIAESMVGFRAEFYGGGFESERGEFSKQSSEAVTMDFASGDFQELRALLFVQFAFPLFRGLIPCKFRRFFFTVGYGPQFQPSIQLGKVKIGFVLSVRFVRDIHRIWPFVLVSKTAEVQPIRQKFLRPAFNDFPSRRKKRRGVSRCFAVKTVFAEKGGEKRVLDPIGKVGELGVKKRLPLFSLRVVFNVGGDRRLVSGDVADDGETEGVKGGRRRLFDDEARLRGIDGTGTPAQFFGGFVVESQHENLFFAEEFFTDGVSALGSHDGGFPGSGRRNHKTSRGKAGNGLALLVGERILFVSVEESTVIDDE